MRREIVVRANTRRWAKLRPARLRWPVAAVAAAAVGLTVAGCGQTQLGAAALYSNQRISAETLASQVANLNAGYQQYRTKVTISYKPPAMPRQVLTWMLRFATTDQLAARKGIKITPAQAQAQLGLEAERAKQSGDTLREVAVLNGLPPDMLPQLGRWLAIQNKVVSLLDNGVAPKTTKTEDALLARLDHAQCLAAKSLSIKVNPQYGALDYSSLVVVPTVNTLSARSLTAKSPATKHPPTKC